MSSLSLLFAFFIVIFYMHHFDLWRRWPKMFKFCLCWLWTINHRFDPRRIEWMGPRTGGSGRLVSWTLWPNFWFVEEERHPCCLDGWKCWSGMLSLKAASADCSHPYLYLGWAGRHDMRCLILLCWLCAACHISYQLAVMLEPWWKLVLIVPVFVRCLQIDLLPILNMLMFWIHFMNMFLITLDTEKTITCISAPLQLPRQLVSTKTSTPMVLRRKNARRTLRYQPRT